MYSKEQSKRLRQEFWTAFGKSYPRKWIRYDTKIKGLSLKFHFDLCCAMVIMDVESDDLQRRIDLWERVISLRSILQDEYLPLVQFQDDFSMGHKEVSRVFLIKENVCIHNKNTWQETMEFLSEHMLKLEAFFRNYRPLLDA